MSLDAASLSALQAALAQERDARIAFLQSLVQTPSDNPPGDCTAIAETTADRLERHGFAVERHAVPDQVVRAHGMLSCTNLIVRQRFGSGDGPVVALNAHGDVVPPGDGWQHAPYGGEIDAGALYGRGAAVSKADIASYTFALKALAPVADRLNGVVELHITFDEEIGGLIGPKWILDQGLSKPSLCISAGLSHSVVTAHNGCLHLEVTVRGRSAHAAAPHTGHDALEAANDVLTALYAQRAILAEQVSATAGIGSPQLTIGLISGGINTNVVPDKVSFRLDRRLIPEEDASAVEAALMQLIQGAVAHRPGIALDIKRLLRASPLRQLDGAELLIDPIQRHGARVFGHPLEIEGVPLYTDARLYAEAGVPTVSYGAGPRSFLEANGHRAEEHVRLSDFDGATEVVACTLAELLGA